MIPTLAHIEDAYRTTAKVTQETPLLRSDALARQSGAAAVFVKPESLQWAGSFKVRGAYWRLTRLSEAERKRGVVAHSSGNFAQGLAAAGQALAIPVTIVMPDDAPAAKREAAAGYGATVVVTHHGERAREEVSSERARAIAGEEDRVLLHPFDDPEIVAGHAGAGLEALRQLAALGAKADMLVCPTGGGGLIGGMGLAFNCLSPQTRVIAVEPQGFDGMGRALASGAIETVSPGQTTICDGLMSRRPGEAPFAALRQAGATGCTVDTPAVRRAMRAAFERLKLVLEPSGAAGLAALLDGGVDFSGKSVVVVATGGNVSFADFAKHVGDA